MGIVYSAGTYINTFSDAVHTRSLKSLRFATLDVLDCKIFIVMDMTVSESSPAGERAKYDAFKMGHIDSIVDAVRNPPFGKRDSTGNVSGLADRVTRDLYDSINSGEIAEVNDRAMQRAISRTLVNERLNNAYHEFRENMWDRVDKELARLKINSELAHDVMDALFKQFLGQWRTIPNEFVTYACIKTDDMLEGKPTPAQGIPRFE